MRSRAAAGALALAWTVLLGGNSALASSPSPAATAIPATTPSAVLSSPPTPSTVPSVTPAPQPPANSAAPPQNTQAGPGADSQAAGLSPTTGSRQRLADTLSAGLAAQQHLSDALRQNQDKQANLAASLQASRVRVAELDTELTARDARIQSTQERIAQQQRAIGLLVRSIYVQPDSLLLRLVQAGSLARMTLATSDTMAAASRGEQLRSGLDRDLGGLRDEQARMQADREEQASLQARQEAGVQAIEQLRAEQQKLSQDLENALGATQDALHNLGRATPAEADRISRQLQAEVQRIIESSTQQVWTDVGLQQLATPVDQLPSSSGHSRQYRYIWPVPEGQLTQGFGPTDLWFEPSFNGFAHFHTGIDIAAPEGVPVRAADDGMVESASTGNTGYGNYVVIAHGRGVTSLYGHLEKILVKAGDRVRQGETVGLEGSTGFSTGPHVHFELRSDGQPVDPLGFLPPGGPSAFAG